MATSGSVDFLVTRDNIIKYALQNVGALGEGVDPTATQLTDSSMYLNMLMKSWHNDGMPLWALKEGFILPIADTNSVTLGPSGGHATLSYVHTQLSADASATDTTITVDSITGISASDYIGVELDDGTIDWTTVSGAPSGSTVTLAAGLDDDAATDRHVWVYTTKIQRPLRIIEATRFNVETSIDVEMIPGGHKDFYDLSNKTTEGEPNTIWYDPQLLNGIAHFWPRFQNGKSLIKIWFHRPFEDFDSATDNPDCPQEFYMALVWELSARLAPSYGLSVDERNDLKRDAKILKDEAFSYSVETGSLRFQPASRSR